MSQKKNTVIDNVYDYLFENSKFIDLNFCDVFPDSYVDENEGVIYLARKATTYFKIKIEEVAA